MPITNREAINYFNVVSEYIRNNTTNKLPIKFTYALVRNQKKLQDLVEYLDKTTRENSTPTIKAMQEAWNAKRAEFALKHGDTPAMAQDGLPFVDPAKTDEYNKVCMAMLDENEGWREAYDARQREIDTLHESTCDFEPYFISLDNFPDEMSPIDMHNLSFMVKE